MAKVETAGLATFTGALAGLAAAVALATVARCFVLIRGAAQGPIPTCIPGSSGAMTGCVTDQHAALCGAAGTGLGVLYERDVLVVS